MSKFGFFARKPAPPKRPIDPAAANDNPLELDEELFSALGAQIGGENETLRKCCSTPTTRSTNSTPSRPRSASWSIRSARRCALSKPRRPRKRPADGAQQTRTAYGKLRNEVAELEKKTAASDSECQTLRQELATTQSLLRTLETTKAEIAIDIAARRAQIAELE